MKYVRHQPGYTPEAAAARRLVTEIARKQGIAPRKLRRKVRKVLFSSLRIWLEKQMLLQLGEFTKLGGFHSGGVIESRGNETIPLICSGGGSVIPKAVYDRMPKVVLAENQVSMKTITEIKLIDPADLPPEKREAFEARMAWVRETVERHWDDQMKSLVRGRRVPARPSGVELKSGDLS